LSSLNLLQVEGQALTRLQNMKQPGAAKYYGCVTVTYQDSDDEDRLRFRDDDDVSVDESKHGETPQEDVDLYALLEDVASTYTSISVAQTTGVDLEWVYKELVRTLASYHRLGVSLYGALHTDNVFLDTKTKPKSKPKPKTTGKEK